MRIDRYKDKLNDREIALGQKRAERSLLVDQLDQEIKKSGSALARKKHLNEVILLLNKTAEESREAGRQRLENVVTRALQSIFGADFNFEIEIDESAGKPVAKFYVCSVGENGVIIKNEPQDSRGGGINDIIATALQVATMVIYNEPKLQGPIILDEPGKHISEEYAVKFGEFLEFISKVFNRQIIMVTHQPHLALTADLTLTSQIIGGRTRIKEHKDGDYQAESATEATLN